MNLYQCFLTGNDCYKTNEHIKPKGIMVHSTGANNPNLRRYVQPAKTDKNYNELIQLLGKNNNNNDWNRSGLKVCTHGFLGKLADGSVAFMQTLPWDMRGWHAGTGTSGKSANNTHISFEICEDGLSDRTYFEKIYKEAVEVVAMLCIQYDLDPMKKGVVICHSEGYTQGIASNHADVMHWFPKHGKNMDDFRKDVKKAMEEGEEVTQEQFNQMMDVWIAERAKLGAPNWFKNSKWQDWVEDNKIIQGNEKGQKMYQSFLTRAEASKMLYDAVHLDE